MKRYIKDFTSINEGHILLIRKCYPNGFDEHDLVALKSANGGYSNYLEVKSDEVVYLVHVNHDLLEKIDNFEKLVDRRAALGDEDIEQISEDLA